MRVVKQCALILMLVLISWVVRAEPASLYRYGYTTPILSNVDETITRHTLNLINPSDVAEPPMIITLPDNVSVCGDPSPDGRWLIVCYSRRETYYLNGLMLLDMKTGEIRNIKEILVSDDAVDDTLEPQWSADSRYLAFNEYSLSISIKGIDGVYLYEIDAGVLTTLAKNGDSQQMGSNAVDIAQFRLWLPDSTHMILTRQTCSKATFQESPRCAAAQIEIRRIPDMMLLATIQAVSTELGWDICRLTASPAGRYVTFEPYCDPFGVGIPFREVFVWDTLQNSIFQLTANTNPHPDTWTEYPPEKYATYAPFWYDSRTLLLGVRSESLLWGDNGYFIDPATWSARTEIYRLDDTQPTVVFDDAVRSWARNSISNQVAFRKEKSFVGTNGEIEITENMVQIATFDGQHFAVLASVEGGCRDLQWSPDGRIVAYQIARDPFEPNDCNTFATQKNIRFLTADGAVSGYELPPMEDVSAGLGWLQVPVAGPPDAAFFPQGTPTAIPTVICCG